MNKTTSLNRFLEFKKTSVKSKDKLKDIERYISRFINSSKKQLDSFDDDEVIRFLNSLNFKIRTMNDIKSYLKSFIKFNYTDWSSKFRNLDKICKTQKPEQAFSPDQMLSYEQVEKIIKKETDLSWKVYWLVFFYGGFRPSEACKLRWEQIFFEDRGVIIKLHATKTKKDFLKSLPKEAEHKLKELKQNSNSEFLFPSPLNKNDTIRARSVCGRLKRISKKALGFEVVPYQLRTSLATLLYSDDNKKDDDVAQQLGHTKDMRHVYKNLDAEKIKQKARGLWGKPLTPEEKDKIKALEEKLRGMEEDNEKLREFTKEGIKKILDLINQKNIIELEDEFGIVGQFPKAEKIISKKN